MASPPANGAKTSRWGAFLAGVESRLDTILADEDQPSGRPRAEGSQQVHSGRQDSMAPPSLPKASGESISRPSSTSRAQDRLNEKMAKAMANRNLRRMEDKSPATSTVPSRAETPANGIASSRQSSELSRDSTNIEQEQPSGDSLRKQEAPKDLVEPKQEQQPPAATTQELAGQTVDTPSIRSSLDSHRSSSVRQSLDLPRTSIEIPSPTKANGVMLERDVIPSLNYDQTIKQMQSDYEAAELRRQEEVHTYLEHIDALQSKLQYLTKEAAEMAKKAKPEAHPGSIEDKMAVKDEKIALLMEEGHKLSQTEMKHMSIIKKLRAKSIEDDKRTADMKKLSEKHEQAARSALERAKRAEETEKRASEKTRGLPKLMKDLEILRAERDAQNSLIQDLQAQVSEVTSAARQAEEKAQAEALQAERKRTADLVVEISKTNLDKEVAERQYQSELRDLREKSEREKERARIAEIERQGEQSILESRLEAYRARAEEASAGSGGHVQAKLLRQIEILQNQYSLASENWQGIESSLLARATGLEKERDEIAKREADARRKVRETRMQSRRAEEELERATTRAQDLDRETSQQRLQLASLREKLAKAVEETVAARNELMTQRECFEAKQAQCSEGNTTDQQDDSSRNTPDVPRQSFHTESPVASGRNRKASNADRASPHNSRRLQGLAITGASTDRPLSRRSSTQPFHHSSDHHRSLSRQDSMSFMVSGGILETPSIQIDNQDDFFDGVGTPATPERTINDMISVSTAGAGPSVQLVERMSAAVRRLESEKATHKDELARLLTQRDEAREQIVGLMKEAEEKRAAESRATKLEQEVAGLNARYLTTLEMLGEKSETVDELKADVADLKEMYKELVDRTMK
ncbi:MAG: hypothetical protein LQ352_001297 [Teloschistes flavicans]|nr:MAG: hypothetical protein LQ352_001297 [Teloschistes flavicans]